MFSLSGYRPPTIQHVRPGPTWMAHSQQWPSMCSSRAPERRSSQRIRWTGAHDVRRSTASDDESPRGPRRSRSNLMRAPGTCPGMFGLEVAMDELAVACAADPIALRVRNEPQVDPETGQPHASDISSTVYNLGRDDSAGTIATRRRGPGCSRAGGPAWASPVHSPGLVRTRQHRPHLLRRRRHLHRPDCGGRDRNRKPDRADQIAAEALAPCNACGWKLVIRASRMPPTPEVRSGRAALGGSHRRRRRGVPRSAWR